MYLIETYRSADVFEAVPSWASIRLQAWRSAMLDLVAQDDEPIQSFRTLALLGLLEVCQQSAYRQNEEERLRRKMLDEVLRLVLLWKEDKEVMRKGIM
jgi:hypothetical protein